MMKTMSYLGYDHNGFVPTYIYFLAYLSEQSYGLLVPAICNCASGVQLHEVPQSHCCDNTDDALLP